MQRQFTIFYPYFWKHVRKTDTCWLWTGSTWDGYGKFFWRKTHHAHRYLFEVVNGRIPVGLQLDHLCRVRNCVRPDHLEAVSQRVNMARGLINGQKWQTHCIHGHAFDEANTYRNDGRRRCRTCVKLRMRQFRAKQKMFS